MKRIVNVFAVRQARRSLRAPLLRAGFCIATLIFSFSCNNSPTPVAQNANAVTNSSPERAQTAIAHSSEKSVAPTAPSSTASKWSQSGDAFDTSEYDVAIAAAEKTLGAKPADEKLKLALGAAYLKRATALTEKRQYASALGDYRRTLKYDPANAEAKQWIEQIINIYKSINRSYPAEGEEPPPLPWQKPAR